MAVTNLDSDWREVTFTEFCEIVDFISDRPEEAERLGVSALRVDKGLDVVGDFKSFENLFRS